MADKKLYIKNDKGRYEEYREPQPPFDNVLYKKVQRGKKCYYEPQRMQLGYDLDEGVWVIVKNPYGKSYTSGKYMNESFLCLKASDIQDMPLSKLGGMEKLASWLSDNLDKLPKNTSQYDFCRAIVGLLFKYEEDGKGE